MRRRSGRVSENLAEYYDRRGVLREIADQPVEFALDEDLRKQILKGMRTRRLENISIKLDPVQIQALRKIATMKSIPYQTLIRQWLADSGCAASDRTFKALAAILHVDEVSAYRTLLQHAPTSSNTRRLIFLTQTAILPTSQSTLLEWTGRSDDLSLLNGHDNQSINAEVVILAR